MPKVLSVFERAREYESEGFYVFDKHKKVMMCKYCNVTVDWKRKDSCEKHCKQRSSHKVNKDNGGNGVKRQITIIENVSLNKKLKAEKTKLAKDTVRAFVQANILLEKLDHPGLRSWMNEYIPGSGDLPHSSTLRSTYLESLKVEEEEKIKELVKGQDIVLLCDETTNKKGQCVFVVLFKIMSASSEQKLLVAGTKVLMNANSTECSRAIVDILVKFDVKYDNVISFTCDSAKYMTKCADLLRVLVSDKLLHIQCWAHKLCLVGNIWVAQLSELNECVMKTKMFFLNSRKRKHHYLQFLTVSSIHPKLFPSPVLTRWNSWFRAVEYIDTYLPHLLEYFKTEDAETSGSSTEYYMQMSMDKVAVLQCEARFVVEHCKSTVELLEILEGSSYPFAHRLLGKLYDLKTSFKLASDNTFHPETTQMLNSQLCLKSAVRATLVSTGQKSLLKLSSLIASDPAKDFVECMGALFDPREIACKGLEVDAVELQNKVEKVPFLSQVPFRLVLEGYTQTKQAVLKSISKNVDILTILLSLKSDFPEYATNAVKCLWIPVSNVDSERAFSMYSNIMSDKRTSLRADNIEVMLGMCFGASH
ncbi:uncharacterized protein LOC134533894 [Bacillus rossius redtenbacheri]|uniref:uncharacterized protein LOC134533894 n=1 Tax=Bacillus rossius redtenbacheri TaxID=93214 RepID=UPI002FDCB21C